MGDSAEKRQRERRKREKRKEKADRKRDREETKGTETTQIVSWRDFLPEGPDTPSDDGRRAPS